MIVSAGVLNYWGRDNLHSHRFHRKSIGVICYNENKIEYV